MKSVLVILKNIVTPVFIVFLCLAGVTSSIISFAVEYFTLQPLLTLEDNNPMVKAIPIALIITIVLEATKNGCCIVSPALKAKKKNLGKLATVLWWLLMIFSIICTTIYTTNTLYSNVAEDSINAVNSLNSTLADYSLKLSNLEQKLEDVTDKKHAELNNIDLQHNDVNNLNDFIKKYAESYEIAMNSAKETQNEVSKNNSITYVDNNRPTGEKIAAIEAATEAYNNAKDAYDNAKKEAQALYEKTYTESVSSITKNYDNQISTVNKQISELSELIEQTKTEINSSKTERYLDKYTRNLNVFLIFIEQFFSSQTSPHERFYQFFVILISLIVAIVLEVIIRFTDQFIGQSLTELSDQLIDNTIDDELTNHQKHLKAKCETFIEFFIKALLCCGVYFVTYIVLIIIINSKTPDPKYFISLAIVEFVAYFIIQWIIDFMTVKIGTHQPINYTPRGKVGAWLNDSFGTQKTVNNIFVTITSISNFIPKWVWLLLVYTICPMIASLFFKISDITSLDEFYWQFASSIVTFLFSSVITKSEHT